MYGWIYVIHFDRPLGHARHYVGSTGALRQRLCRHAHGHGSRLTRELHKRGIGFRLGGLFRAKPEWMRRIERLCKAHHQAAHFCGFCRPDVEGGAYRPPCVTPVDIDLLTFPTDSETLAKLSRSWAGQVRVKISDVLPADRAEVERFIIPLMNKEHESVGFIPVGGTQGIGRRFNLGRVSVARAGPKLVGYCIWDVHSRAGRLRVNQLVVLDEYRLCGIGKRFIDHLAMTHDTMPLCCVVREDLPANDFWRTMGFAITDITTHKTSGSKLVHYERAALWDTK